MKFPLNMEHEISWNNAGIRLCASLRIDCVIDIAQIMENIEFVEHKQEISFYHRVCDARVPRIIGFVERRL